MAEEENKYVRNFKKVIETVRGYTHLFTPEEKTFMRQLYKELDIETMKLFVRMFFCSKRWFSFG